jgi:hypothetical protein
MMSSYEIRLLNGEGRLSLIYMTMCASDDEAKDKIRDVINMPYSHFEIWRDMELISEGDRALRP